MSEPKRAARSSDEIILKATNLKKYYPIRRGVMRRTVGHVKAVDGVSFELRRGETWVSSASPVAESRRWADCSSTGGAHRGTVEMEGRVVKAGEEMRRLRRDVQIVFQIRTLAEPANDGR